MNINIIHKEELENLNEKSMSELFSLYRLNCSWNHFIAENPYVYLESDHVIDEDKSVKWNREQVEINNNSWKEYQDQSKIARANIDNMIEAAIVCNLMNSYGFSHDVAVKVYNKAYSEWHDDLATMKLYLEDLADFAAEILKCDAE